MKSPVNKGLRKSETKKVLFVESAEVKTNNGLAQYGNINANLVKREPLCEVGL